MRETGRKAFGSLAGMTGSGGFGGVGRFGGFDGFGRLVGFGRFVGFGGLHDICDIRRHEIKTCSSPVNLLHNLEILRGWQDKNDHFSVIIERLHDIVCFFTEEMSKSKFLPRNQLHG